MSKPTAEAAVRARGKNRAFPMALGAFLVVLLFLFYRSFQPELVLFANDGPLGANSAAFARMPQGFTGMWQDLTWVGGTAGAGIPSFTGLMFWWLQPLAFAKFYGPLCLLILALSAWLTFRALDFRPVVCTVGGLAAMLNSDLFSYTAWGLGSHTLAVASAFLAVAVLQWQPTGWNKAVLAGLAIGMAVMEGFDSGAILSLYVAALAVYQAWIGSGPPSKRLILGMSRLTVVAAAAAWIAAFALFLLIGTQIKGVVGMEQDPTTRAQRWDGATQWSLPKTETLRLIIPGLFGYRLDTPGGGNYWGGIGRDAAWEEYLSSPKPDPTRAPHAGQFLRHSGAGFYTGVFVVLLALFAVAQSARGHASVFHVTQRRWIWFWSGAALVSLLLALGRHAPFYQVVYALPYFSTIRNPVKFLHPFSLSMVILFGYGLQAVLARYRNGLEMRGAWSWSGWWSKADAFERKFLVGCGVAFAAALVGWMLYAKSQEHLVRHLQLVGFEDPGSARRISEFSVAEVGWFALFLALSCGWLVLSLAGFFRGPRAALMAGISAGVLLTVDMVRANTPWIQYYNYREKYASDAVIDLLRDRAYERRVSGMFLDAGPQAAAAQGALQQVYVLDWMQHLFPYYTIPSLDVVQEPRASVENTLYRAAFLHTNALVAFGRRTRQWELTSTRYLLGLAGFVDPLNQQIDAVRNRFRLLTGFDLRQDRPDGPIRASTNANGPFGIIEFTGALPKASLFTEWEVVADRNTTLERLVDPTFDPARLVLLDQDPWPGQAARATDATGGIVRFEHYESKRIRLSAEAASASVLLLNDKYDPSWEVTLDGQPASLLRANYLMRGVAVPPGKHTIEFRFRPPTGMLYVSVSAMLFGLGLSGYAVVVGRWRSEMSAG